MTQRFERPWMDESVWTSLAPEDKLIHRNAREAWLAMDEQARENARGLSLMMDQQEARERMVDREGMWRLAVVVILFATVVIWALSR
jgi:hypothetical protein